MPHEPDILLIFKAQMDAHLREASALLLTLEAAADPHPGLQSLMRIFHTIKGAARAIHFETIKESAHAMEDLFHALMQQELALHAGVVELGLHAIDLLQSTIEATEDAALQGAHQHLRLQIKRCMAGEEVVLPDTDARGPSAADQGGAERRTNWLSTSLAREHIDRLFELGGEIGATVGGYHDLRSQSCLFASQLHRFEGGLNRFFASQWPDSKQFDFQDPRLQLPAQMQEMRKSYLQMMELQEQMVARLQGLAQNIARESALARLVPFEEVFADYARQLRDLAKELGKSCRLEIQNGQLRVDRSVLEALRLPLLHALRNALGHGIESPELRRQRGKAVEGCIQLRLGRQGDRIRLEMQDDGAGIDEEALQRLVQSRALLPAGKWQHLSAAERWDLLFRPGISTAQTVTDLHGRGMGLNIVRTEVERLGGQVNLTSTPQQGTLLTLELPMLLAATAVVTVLGGEHPFFGKQYYAFPLSGIREILPVTAEQKRLLQQRPAVRIGEEIVPLVSFADWQGLSPLAASEAKQRLLLLGGSEQRLALLVEKVVDLSTLLHQPLPAELGVQPGFEGVSTIQDNRIVLIAENSRLLGTALRYWELQAVAAEPASEDAPSAQEIRNKTILVVEDSHTVREVARHFLQSAGYDVLMAVNGEDGLQRLHEHPQIDLIMTDLDMPRMNGLAMIQAIRQQQREEHLPIIVVSYKEDPAERQRALQVGADHFVNKSEFDSTIVLNTIRTILHQAV
ncbi:MAG: response regulator [Magnetococcales bacterium]|nr:response regulator [Magnetococcales bacterium]MBF0114222.1 response regulator [Magnetococcales bacterium]